MKQQLELIKAIHSGDLAAVKALLDAGVSVRSDGRCDEPSMELGIACLMGYIEIVRELIARGAPVNCNDNTLATSPLSMAIRGGKEGVICALIELGADLPEGLNTGLSEHQVTLSHLKAVRDGHCHPRDFNHLKMANEYQEIDATRLPGTDTEVLESEALRKIIGGMG